MSDNGQFFLAYSSDDAVRRYSSSGGFSKELMRFAVVSGYVDKLVFPKMSGPRPEVCVTADPSALMSPATNSIYHPVPVLKGLKQLNEGETCAISLLPCNVRFADRDIAKLVIELVCNHVPKANWTTRILKRLGVAIDHVTSLTYRTGDWPGMFQVACDGGSVTSRRFSGLWDNSVSDTFPTGCRSCDETYQRGDVVVADPWGIETPYSGEPGKTMVNVRSDAAMQLVADCDRITTEPISESLWDRVLKPLHNVKRDRRRSS